MNRVEIQYTRFVNLDSDGNENDSTFGYRLYDDYGSVYNNTFSCIKELQSAVNPDSILEYLSEYHNDFWESVVERGLFLDRKSVV